MKLISFLLSLTLVPAVLSARNQDIAADLASAGYVPGIARDSDHHVQPAALSTSPTATPFAISQQITADLASAGYLPTGLTSPDATDHVVRVSLPRTQVDRRIGEALRGDLISAGYGFVTAPLTITVSLKE